MATVTSPATKTKIGPGDQGRRMTLDEFVAAEGMDGYLYELARGIVVVTQVPGINHGWIVERVNEVFVVYKLANPGRIIYRAGGGECRLRLAGMQSDRHPDQAVYLTPPPRGKRTWHTWVPAIVVEVVSKRGEDRDYVEKREEYLRCGILEYWIFDPYRRKLLVLRRELDVWVERELGESDRHETGLLPGLVVPVGEVLGAPLDEDEAEEDDEIAAN